MAKLISTNPAKNYAIIGEVEVSTLQEIKGRVAAAHEAKKRWKTVGIKNRVEILRSVYKEFVAKSDEISILSTKETGRAIMESKKAVAGHINKIKWFLDNAEVALADEITFEDDETLHKIIYEPIGVAAVITPWNHPFGMFVWGVIPNLLSGNTVIFKISEECPLMGKLIEKIMLKHLPKGVFSEVYGGENVGWKLANEKIDIIWFTGSSKVGQKLYKLAGVKFIKAVLELGGSNPCIVFEDADLEEATKKIYNKRRFTLAGQVCDALKRLIVHHSILEKVVENLQEELEKKQVGDPEDENTDMGSLAAKRQLDLLKDQVEDAVKKGAEVVIGGRVPHNLKGAYYLPTILTNVKKGMRVWDEEVFGPVIPIISFETEEEAIQLANDTKYGLGAIILTKDMERAKRVASLIEAGTVEINNANHWLDCNPFGGYKKSGMGREHGILGFRELCQVKVISIEK